jgi:hypothetical protein
MWFMIFAYIGGPHPVYFAVNWVDRAGNDLDFAFGLN